MAGSKKSLLDDDDGVDVSLGNLSVNQSYAKRFEHNKKREELHRLQAKHPELAERLERKALKQAAGEADGGYEEDESTSEEEDDGDIPDDTEAQIFDTLLKIRSKDPAIYDSNVRFFKEEETDEDDKDGDKAEDKKKSKPQYLKDVLARQALEHGPEGVSSDSEAEGGSGAGDEEGDERGQRRPVKVYDREQEEIRKAFLSAAQEAVDGEAEGDGFGGVLKKRATTDDGDDGDSVGDGSEGGAGGGKKKAKKKVVKLVDKYFGHAEDEADAFLREFILNKGWVDREEQGYIPSYQEVVGVDEDVDDEVDEAHLEEMDRYEAAYNFRFEEPGGAGLVTHPRQVEGSVRRPDERRKKQRDARKERQREAEAAREEEIKRLKNLKKKEIEERLSKVAKVAGAALAVSDDPEDEEGQGVGGKHTSKVQRGKGKSKVGAGLKLDPKLLEGDFDPEEWDRQMAAAFDDDYYEEEDEELAALMNEDSDGEGGLDDVDQGNVGALISEGLSDEDMGGASGEEEEGEDGLAGFKALRKKLKARDRRAVKEEQEEEEEGVQGGEQDPQAVAAAAEARAELNRLLEEYFKLDHEGVAGGIKTRFKYRSVPAANYGLSADDVLFRSDKELNQVVGMKKLAPYRDDQLSKQHNRPNYKALQELRSQPAQDRHKHKRPWKDGHRVQGGWGGVQGSAGVQKHRGHDRQDRHSRGGDQHQQKEHSQHKDGHKADTEQDQPGSEQGAGNRPEQQGQVPKGGAHGGSGAHQGQKGSGHQQRKSGGHNRPVLDEAAARKASYAALGGPKVGAGASGGDGSGKKRKREGEGTADNHGKKANGGAPGGGAGEAGDGLTKAQRKNMKRTAKKAAKRAATASGGAADAA